MKFHQQPCFEASSSPSFEYNNGVMHRCRRFPLRVTRQSQQQGAMPNVVVRNNAQDARHRQLLDNISCVNHVGGSGSSKHRRRIKFGWTLVVAILALLSSENRLAQVSASTTTTTTTTTAVVEKKQQHAANNLRFRHVLFENRKLDEEEDNEEEQQQDNEQEDEENIQDDEQEDEEEEEDDNEEEEDNSKDNQIEQDDFFEDALADDVVVSDHSEARDWHYDDDFYAYVGDPAPPTLLPLQGRFIVGYIIACLGLMLGKFTVQSVYCCANDPPSPSARFLFLVKRCVGRHWWRWYCRSGVPTHYGIGSKGSHGSWRRDNSWRHTCEYIVECA